VRTAGILFSMHYSFIFSDISSEKKELLIAFLADDGFEGFEETATELKAVIKKEDFNETGFLEIISSLQVQFEQSEIQPLNWNAEWESNFSPVTVTDKCGAAWVHIRAGFHPAFEKAQHEIIITPKMSFGTGHHATTYLVTAMMNEIDFVNKAVIDFGTGTGVLAILADKMGAAKIDAIDNDDWSIENANENIVTNGCSNISLRKAENLNESPVADVIIANINLNIILANLTAIHEHGKPGTVVLLSGILETDKVQICEALTRHQFEIKELETKEKWMAIKANI
jgi:ribosomal protein L11 methyltransferase